MHKLFMFAYTFLMFSEPLRSVFDQVVLHITPPPPPLIYYGNSGMLVRGKLLPRALVEAVVRLNFAAVDLTELLGAHLEITLL